MKPKKSFFYFLLFFIGISSLYSQTDGTLTFTFTPVSHSGNWGAKHNLAVWIQTNSGAFVKTKMRYVGSGTSDHLPTWGANAGCASSTNANSSTCNTTDATTGATLNSYSTKTFTWDGKNVNGTANGTTVADGTYRVAVEETWNHGTSGTTVRYFTFTKGTATDHQTPANDSNFTNITLDWVPTTAGVADVNLNEPKVYVYPNPSNGLFMLDIQSEIKYINVFNVLGEKMYQEELTTENNNTTKELNFTSFVAGLYYVQVIDENGNKKNIEIVLEK